MTKQYSLRLYNTNSKDFPWNSPEIQSASLNCGTFTYVILGKYHKKYSERAIFPDGCWYLARVL